MAKIIHLNRPEPFPFPQVGQFFAPDTQTHDPVLVFEAHHVVVLRMLGIRLRRCSYVRDASPAVWHPMLLDRVAGLTGPQANEKLFHEVVARLGMEQQACASISSAVRALVNRPPLPGSSRS